MAQQTPWTISPASGTTCCKRQGAARRWDSNPSDASRISKLLIVKPPELPVTSRKKAHIVRGDRERGSNLRNDVAHEQGKPRTLKS